MTSSKRSWDSADVNDDHHQDLPSSHISPSSPKTAQISRLTCDICRERKVRCDKGWPKCGRCERLDEPCIYRTRAARHRNQESAEEVQGLRNRSEAGPSQRQDSPSGVSTRNESVMPGQRNMTPGLSQGSTSAAGQSEYIRRIISDTSGPDLGYGHGAGPSAPLPQDMFNNLDWLSAAPTTYVASHAIHNEGLAASLSSPDEAASPRTAMPGLNLASAIISSTYPESPCSDDIPASLMKEFHRSFFDTFYPVLPILAKHLFFANIKKNKKDPQIQALKYSVALVGATVFPKYEVLEKLCLDKTRHFIELCERDDDPRVSLSFELFQAFQFLIQYELTHRQIVQAWKTIGRAVRLASILNLHRDPPETEASEVTRNLPPTDDPVCIEERRRAFWALFTFETWGCSRARHSPQLQEEHISIPLPSPGRLDKSFVLCATPTLAQSYDVESINCRSISSFAAIALICALSRHCEPSAPVVSPENSAQAASFGENAFATYNIQAQSFWNQYLSALSLLHRRTQLLARHLTVRAVRRDPIAFASYAYLCGIDIQLQDAAIAEIRKQGISPVIAAECMTRSRAAAYRLAGAVRATLLGSGSSKFYFSLLGAFMARPVAAAAQALGEDLHQSPNSQTSSAVADALQLLLTSLDEIEDGDGFWHETVVSIAKMAQDWEVEHDNRSADTWGSAFLGDKFMDLGLGGLS